MTMRDLEKIHCWLLYVRKRTRQERPEDKKLIKEHLELGRVLFVVLNAPQWMQLERRDITR